MNFATYPEVRCETHCIAVRSVSILLDNSFDTAYETVRVEQIVGSSVSL